MEDSVLTVDEAFIFLMQRSVSEVSKSDNITDKVAAKVKGRIYSLNKKVTQEDNGNTLLFYIFFNNFVIY